MAFQNTTARANATLMMLARNSDVDSAGASIRSVQKQFNDHFKYPGVFLNDQQWTSDFKERVTKVVGEGAEVRFDIISKDMWGYPEWIDQGRARAKAWMTCRTGESYMLGLKGTTTCVVSSQGS